MIKKVLYNKGFTLVELIVTIAIFVFMTGFLMTKYGKFNDNTLINNLAYDVALTIRQAQTYGLNVRGQDVNQNRLSYVGNYGVHFDIIENNKQFILFLDQDGDGRYEDDDDVVVDTINIRGRNYISYICVGYGENNCVPPPDFDPGWLDITFKRPDPNAIITSSHPSGFSAYGYAEIHVRANSDSNDILERVIVVNEAGLIGVN